MPQVTPIYIPELRIFTKLYGILSKKTPILLSCKLQLPQAFKSPRSLKEPDPAAWVSNEGLPGHLRHGVGL